MAVRPQSRTTPAWTSAVIPVQRESSFFITAFVLLAVMSTISLLTSFLHR
jgi:hypothetical protein